MGKMFPRNAGQINGGINKLLIWFLVYSDLVFRKNLDFFTLFGIFFFEVLGKLPNKVGVTGYPALLFFGKIIVQLDFGGILGLDIHRLKCDASTTATQHHPPAQTMAFFGPQYIILEEMVP